MIRRKELDGRWWLWKQASRSMPEFNPAWSIEEKELWFKNYRTIVKAAIYLARCEDELAWWEHPFGEET